MVNTFKGTNTVFQRDGFRSRCLDCSGGMMLYRKVSLIELICCDLHNLKLKNIPHDAHKF